MGLETISSSRRHPIRAFLSNPYNYVIPSFTDSTEIELCIGEVLEVGENIIEGAGTNIISLVSNQGGDGLVTFFVSDLDLIVLDRVISIFDGGLYKDSGFLTSESGSYTYIEDGSQSCDISNSLELSHYKVYMTNAFSPNGNQINDVFIVSGDDRTVEISRTLYDR